MNNIWNILFWEAFLDKQLTVSFKTNIVYHEEEKVRNQDKEKRKQFLYYFYICLLQYNIKWFNKKETTK